ncbi:MAG: serine/threonine protein kinase [Oligoflexus sp.]|jgi:serine/threonine protein kinase
MLFGEYHLVELVGEGGLGKVYRAYDIRTKEEVAIKFLHERYLEDDAFSGVFHRELLIHKSLQHPALVPIYAGRFQPPHCYIVSRFIDGWSLRSLLAHFGRCPPLVGLSIAIQIAAGLDALHLRDLVHADLSTANILIEKSGRAYLTDFGLTAFANPHDVRKNIFGTPGYYSPEHLINRPIAASSDVYVLGLLIYEMLDGQKFIPAASASQHANEILRRMENPRLGMIKCVAPDLRADLLTLLRTCLEPMAEKRYASGEEVGLVLNKMLRRYRIHSPQQAVLEFLSDGLLSVTQSPALEQDIYWGNVPYQLDDLRFFR